MYIMFSWIVLVNEHVSSAVRCNVRVLHRWKTLAPYIEIGVRRKTFLARIGTADDNDGTAQ